MSTHHPPTPPFSAARLTTNNLTHFTIHLTPYAASSYDSAFAQTASTAYRTAAVTQPLVLSHDIPVLHGTFGVKDVAVLAFVQELALRPALMPLRGMEVRRGYAFSVLWDDERVRAVGCPMWPVWCGVGGMEVGVRANVRVLRTAQEVRDVDGEGMARMMGQVTKRRGSNVWEVDVGFNDEGGQSERGEEEGRKGPTLAYKLDLGELLAPTFTSLREERAPRMKMMRDWLAGVEGRIETMAAARKRASEAEQPGRASRTTDRVVAA